MKRMNKFWPKVVAIMALVLVLMAPLPVGVAQGNKDKDDKGNGSNGNPGVIPPNARPHGMTYGEWSAKWWQWALAIPPSIQPGLDPMADCGVGQSGHVWFLPAILGSGTLTRSCTVPAGKAILVPIISVLNDYPCPDPNFQPAPGQSLEDFLTEGANFFVDNFVTELEVEVDGVSLQNLFNYRATSRLFTFTADPSYMAGDPCITGSPQFGVADGYWIMLAPLSVGTHTIHIRAKLVFDDGGSVELETTYRDLTVRSHKP